MTRHFKILFVWVLVCAGLSPEVLIAHPSDRPSLHDTVAGIRNRLRTEMSSEVLKTLDQTKLLEFLKAEETEVLSSGAIYFSVNVPVEVAIVNEWKEGEEPFWLKQRGFERQAIKLKIGDADKDLALWKKDFEAGPIGLGVNSIHRSSAHYAIAVMPKERRGRVQIADLYPGTLKVSTWRNNAKPYVDEDDEITNVPRALFRQTMIQTLNERRNDARLTDIFLWTRYPAQDKPDQVTLTWGDDPKTTQALQWRTSTNIHSGKVRYQRKDRFGKEPVLQVHALEKLVLESPNQINDPAVHRFTAHLKSLEPDTAYVYSVGVGDSGPWTEWAEFSTAPDRPVPFSFVYMGDAQNGLDTWGQLVHKAYAERPDAAFYIMAGDLVNRGNDQDDWDDFFANSEDIYNRRQLIPAIGNHENQGGHPTWYLKTFDLPRNGPSGLEPERAYSLEYSNALFVILDSNLKPEDQVEWLDETLGNSKADWKFMVYHHPFYSSKPDRDNKDLRKHWLPIFDKYHVDMALQGHDHGYLRTFPMKGEERVESTKDGTVYIVSVSGTKMYNQDARDYTAFGMTHVATYQVLDITIEGKTLTYKAYDMKGRLRDSLVIEK